MDEPKVGDIVKYSNYDRHWVVLNVTKKDMAGRVNADKPGLNCFGQLIEKEEPNDIYSYLKIIPLDLPCDIVGNIKDYTNEKLVELTA